MDAYKKYFLFIPFKHLIGLEPIIVTSKATALPNLAKDVH